jgi:LPXTG-site transpeptidase (sortase) family protein
MAPPIAEAEAKQPQRTPDKRLFGRLLMAAGVALACIAIWRAVVGGDVLAGVYPAPVTGLPGLPPFALQPPDLSPPIAPPLSLAAPAGAQLFPSAVPRPLAPPTGIQIPAIDLEAAIVPVSPFSSTTSSGEIRWAWETAEYAVGHLDRTATPGAGGNVVLAGHNNTKGEVFRDLSRLKVGDVITVATRSDLHPYIVTEVTIIPYRKDPVAGEATLQRYMAGTTTERLTLLSCYPYWTNSDRIVVVAEPPPSARANP